MTSTLTNAGRGARRFSVFLGGSEGGLTHRVLRSGIWVGISSAGQNVLQTVRTVILARLLLPEIFGLIGICYVVIRGLEVLTETGLTTALIQRRERVEEAKNTAFTMQVARGFLLAALACAVAPFAARYYERPELRDVVFVLSLTFVINGFSNINAVLLQKNLDFRRLTSLDLLVALLSTVVTAVFAFALRSVWALVIGQVSTAFLRLGLTYWVVPGRPRFSFDRRIAGELFRYGRFITLLTIVIYVTTEIDNVVVGKVLGLQMLGFYTVAYSLANIPATHISKVAASVIFPAYSTLQGHPEKMRAAYLSVLRFVAGMAVPAAVGLAVLAPEIVRIVYGERWLPMVPVLQILTLFGGARAIGVAGGSLFNAIGKPHISFYISGVKLAAILLAIYPATARYGLQGAAVSVAIPQIVGDAFAIFILKREVSLPITAILRVLGRVVAACGVMAAAVALLRVWLAPIGLIELVLLVLTGIAVYAISSIREAQSLYRDHFRGSLRAGSSASPAA